MNKWLTSLFIVAGIFVGCVLLNVCTADEDPVEVFSKMDCVGQQSEMAKCETGVEGTKSTLRVLYILAAFEFGIVVITVIAFIVCVAQSRRKRRKRKHEKGRH